MKHLLYILLLIAPMVSTSHVSIAQTISPARAGILYQEGQQALSRNDFDTARNRITQLRQGNRTSNADSLELQLLQQELNDAQSKLALQAKPTRTNNVAIEQLRSQIDALQKENSTLQKQLRTYIQDLTTITSANSTALNEYRNQISLLSGQLSTLQSLYEQLQGDYSIQQIKLSTCISPAQIQKDTNQTATRIQELENALALQEKRVQNQTERVQAVVSTNDILRSHNKQLLEQNKQLVNKLTTLQSQIVGYQTDETQLRQSYSSQQAEIQKLIRDNQQLTSQLKQAQIDARNAADNYQTQITTLQNNINTAASIETQATAYLQELASLTGNPATYKGIIARVNELSLRPSVDLVRTVLDMFTSLPTTIKNQAQLNDPVKIMNIIDTTIAHKAVAELRAKVDQAHDSVTMRKGV
ncbi:hypothetical protein J120_04565 [candidate division TM6 bacterium JCVI TM6SC1]|uniref:Uncharacterized protein n=1 Tax=candidate division TM6 bacterium JCVI TM6SC1 TaxID=1306947 RepID=A0A0D2K3V6_9BACT|nr:hypothetical protein J120_04565 [candidate division TM6 bacterium JCVI TM6SC1]